MTAPEQDILSKEHVHALGSLVVAISKLESIVTDLLAVFMRTDIARTIIALHHQQLSSKIDTLLALCHLVFRNEEEFKVTCSPSVPHGQ